MRPLRSYGFAQVRRSVSTDLRICGEADLRFYGFTEIRRCGFPVLQKAVELHLRRLQPHKPRTAHWARLRDASWHTSRPGSTNEARRLPLSPTQRQRPETPPEPLRTLQPLSPICVPPPKSSEAFQPAPGTFPENAHRLGGWPLALTPARGRCAADCDASPERSYLEPARTQLRDRHQPQPGKPLKHRSACPPGERISGACRQRHGDIFWKSCEFSRAIRRTTARAIRRITLVLSGARTSLQATAGVASSLP